MLHKNLKRWNYEWNLAEHSFKYSADKHFWTSTLHQSLRLFPHRPSDSKQLTRVSRQHNWLFPDCLHFQFALAADSSDSPNSNLLKSCRRGGTSNNPNLPSSVTHFLFHVYYKTAAATTGHVCSRVNYYHGNSRIWHYRMLGLHLDLSCKLFSFKTSFMWHHVKEQEHLPQLCLNVMWYSDMSTFFWLLL